MFNNKITGGSIEVGSTMTNNAGIPVVDDFDLHFLPLGLEIYIYIETEFQKFLARQLARDVS